MLLLAPGALLVATAAWGAVESPGRCASLKAKAAGLRLAASFRCHAVATRRAGASSACQDPARKQFERLFARAGKKGSCGEPGDAATIGEHVAAFAADIATGLFPSGTPVTGRRCAAKKMLRAGVYGRGRLTCWARAFRDGVAVDGRCLDGSASKLVIGFRAAEEKPGCATAGDVAIVEGVLDGFLDGIAAAVMPSPATTTTTVVSTSSTTSEPGGGTSTTVAGGATTSTSTVTTPALVSFAGDVLPIFTANCALTGCHTGPSPEEGLDLRPGRAFATLVNVTSRECGQFKRVQPGQPSASYLVFKIVGPPQPCFSGDRMPDGAPPLSAADQATIQAWIMQGALNN